MRKVCAQRSTRCWRPRRNRSRHDDFGFAPSEVAQTPLRGGGHRRSVRAGRWNLSDRRTCHWQDGAMHCVERMPGRAQQQVCGDRSGAAGGAGCPGLFHCFQHRASRCFRLRWMPIFFRIAHRSHVRDDSLASLSAGIRPPRVLRLLSVLRGRHHRPHADRDYERSSARPPMNAARLLFLAAWLAPAIAFCETESPREERHVVVVVWDGMRPDFIDEHNTPALWKLAHDGVRFLHHHSVYVTATNVNGAALATGVYPNRNSLLANREYRPQIDPRKPFENADEEIIRKADQVTGGKYIATPTIAETVRSAGRRTAVVGTKSVAFLHDRHNEWTTAALPKQHFPKFAAAPMSPALCEEMFRLLGPFAMKPANTEEQRNTYATRPHPEV